MERIKISEFKATCHAVLARVEKTGKPVLVTRIGRPVVRITPLRDTPPPPKVSLGAWMGSMRGQGAIIGDLIESVAGTDVGVTPPATEL